MKKYLILCLTFLSLGAYSQMDNGDYTFINEGSELKMSISNDGWSISSIEFSGSKGAMVKGYWKELNFAGADEDYEGSEGWYEFQTDYCSYSFDEPIDGKITLERYDCEDPSRNATIKLIAVK